MLQGNQLLLMPCWFRQLTVDTVLSDDMDLRTHKKTQDRELGEDVPLAERDE